MNNETKIMRVLMLVATLAATAHKHQDRKNGGNYIRHPLAVAALIETSWINLTNMCVAICHDVLEDVPHMLTETAEEMATTFGGRFTTALEAVLSTDDYNEQLTYLLAACNEWDYAWADEVVSGILELTVVWPRPDHPEDDASDKTAKKAWEVERIQSLSLNAAAVTKADKTFNSRHPIPGRDPAKEAAKYSRYFDAVDLRMTRD